MTGRAIIDGLFSDLDQLISHAETHAELLPPSREQELLRTTVSKLKYMREGADTEIVAATDWLRAVGETQLAKVKAFQAELANVRADLATLAAKTAKNSSAAQAAKAAATVKALAPSLDIHLGNRLRDELLSRFDNQAGQSPTSRPPGHDIYEDWE